MPAKPTKKYTAWIDQVNRVRLEVTAANPDEAREKAYRKWRREYAHARIEAIEEQ